VIVMETLSRRCAVLGLASALAACARPTPRFAGAGGAELGDSIAEETSLQMEAAREYLLVRGRNISAPAVLFLHGGPGGSETPLMRLFNPALEDHCVMAYWDQRGAGRSYQPDIPRRTMTIAQFLRDADVVVEHLRKRLNRDRIWLLAHSWGTALGMLYARQHPEKIAGYIGAGQLASIPEDELHAYEFVVGEARKRQDAGALEELARIGPPPYTFDRLVVRDRLLDRYGGYFHTPIDEWSVVLRALFEVPETDIWDLYRVWRGMAMSQQALWPEFARLDLTRDVARLDVPVTFVLGRYDQRTWSPYAAAYLEKLEAPQKKLVWLENSAHNGPFEEPESFRRAVLAAIGAG
jgi:pimeloyl-ACP methyl ester carboxylesterase